MGHLHICIHMAITHTVSQHMHAPKSGMIMPGATTQPVWHLAQEGPSNQLAQEGTQGTNYKLQNIHMT